MGARRKGRELARQGLPGINTSAVRGLLTRKYSPDTLQKICTAATNMPVPSAIAQESGVSTGMIRYLLEASRRGKPGDGLDMTLADGHVERFHVVFEDHLEAGFDDIDVRSLNLAKGKEREILTFQGRVSYKYDERSLALGFTGPEAYLRDEEGNLVPETVPILDAEHIRWVLARRKPKEYGQTLKVEHDHRIGGVVMVTPALTPKQVEQNFGGESKIVDVEFDIPEDDKGDV